MMKESAKEQFKWRFWYLAVILNGIILFLALSVIAFFLFPQAWRVPASVICLFIALVTAVLFRRQYLKTKEWIEKNG
jgi:membrane protein YdbS with pleckstrin-like domain